MNASAHNALFTGGDAGMRSSVAMPALIALAAVLVHVRFFRRSGVVRLTGGTP